jgi:hypothetical protein
MIIVIFVLIVLAILGGFVIAVPLAGLIFLNIQTAKHEARKILSQGHIGEINRANRIMQILSANPSDVEAVDLWKKLQTMKDKPFATS